MLSFIKNLFIKKRGSTTIVEGVKEVINPGPDTSHAGTLDSTDWKKILRDTLVAAASAGISVLIDYTGSLNLGPYTIYLVPGVNFVLTSLLKFVKEAK